MKTRALLLYSFLMFFIGCNTNNASKTEIVQKHRDIIVDVSESIVDIKTEILLGSSHLYITDNFLIVAEISPKNDKCIHLFNKNSFEYLSSTGIIGRGPGEITSQPLKSIYIVDN